MSLGLDFVALPPGTPLSSVALRGALDGSGRQTSPEALPAPASSNTIPNLPPQQSTGTSLLSAGLAFGLALSAVLRPHRSRRGRGTPMRRSSSATKTLANTSNSWPRPGDFESCRADFPALQEEYEPGKRIIYLDNAATSHKPQQVLAKLEHTYKHENSNVHRGMHRLSVKATESFEAARATVAAFVNAFSFEEIVFTRNATEAINLIAQTWGRSTLQAGDEIIVTIMEHHSNLVPWQMVAEATGATIKYVGLSDENALNMEQFMAALSPRTRLVAVAHVSNVLGCENRITEIASKAHEVGAKVLVDACQSVPHKPVDVRELGVDWLVASGHKMCGPSGIGFLWGRASLLRSMPPFLGGGEMIDTVTTSGFTCAELPHKFEAGTPAFAEAAALGAACDYLSALGMDRIEEWEGQLARHLWQRLSEVPGIQIYGPTPEQHQGPRAPLCSFNIEGVHPNDLATLVDQESGVALRAGHHCAQPLHEALGVPSSARLSAHFYNTFEEIDLAVAAVKSAAAFLRTFSSTSASN